jgi:hypothetical protein
VVNGIGYEFSLTETKGKYLLRYDEATKLGAKRRVVVSLDIALKEDSFEFNIQQLE